MIDDHLPILRDRSIHMNINAIDRIIDLALLTRGKVGTFLVFGGEMRYRITEYRSRFRDDATHTGAVKLDRQGLSATRENTLHQQIIGRIVDKFEIDNRRINRSIQPDRT